MGEYTERVATVVAGALEPGERVIAASPGAPRGSMRAIAYGKGRGDRGARAALDAGRSELRAFGVPWAKQYVVVLSDRRLLWFRTSMFGRPKSVVASMVRGDVEDVVRGEGRVLGQRYGELRFTARDGRRCGFEVARPHVALADDLVAAFHQVRR